MVFSGTGQTLTFYKDSLVPCQQVMWDGIYIPNASDKLNLFSSYVEQAMNAVVSENGGVFDISITHFQNCKTAVDVRPYNGTHQGFMTGNFINGTAPLFAPYINAWPNTGVNITNVDSITIGDHTVNYQNVFDSIRFGIVSVNSSVCVYNNLFKYISLNALTVPHSNGCMPGTAICCTGEHQQHIIRVGGFGLYEPNYFQHCDQGITCQTHLETHIINNQFNFIKNTGLECFENRYRILEIKNNSISNFRNAVRLDRCEHSFATISHNNINTAIYGSGPLVRGTGVYVANVNLSSYGELKIDSNNITNCKSAIWLNNVEGLGSFGTSPTVQLFSNTILFSQSAVTSGNISFGQHTGIRMKNCFDVCVGPYNLVSRIGSNPNSGMVNNTNGNNMYGLYDLLSPFCEVRNNDFNNTGAGIYTDGFCDNSRFECNNIDVAYNGFFFNYATIGDQVDYGANQYRQGNSIQNITSAYKLAGTVIDTTRWYFNNNIGILDVSGTTNISLFPNLILIPSTSTTFSNPNCSSFSIVSHNDSVVTRKVVIESDVEEGGGGSVDPDEGGSSYYGTLMAYEFLMHDSTWINLGDSADAMYKEFVDSLSSESFGRFRRFAQFIADNNLSGADTALSNLTIHNIMEANQAYVDSMYLLLQDDYELTTDDSSALFAIADEDPLLGGGAVIDARVLLDYDPEPVGDVNRISSDTDFNIDIKIIPNPNTGTFKIEYPLLENQSYKISIYDIIGNLLFETVSTETIIEIGNKGLKSGVYLVQATLPNGRITTKKIVVIN